MENSAYLLPTANARHQPPEAQGWKVETKVQQSTIPACSRGRFVQEAVPAGTVVCEKPCYFIADMNEALELPANAAITFATGADIEQYVEWVVAKGVARETIVEELVHFIYGFGANLVAVNASTHCSMSPSQPLRSRPSAPCRTTTMPCWHGRRKPWPTAAR